jgi:hypothetical protein
MKTKRSKTSKRPRAKWKLEVFESFAAVDKNDRQYWRSRTPRQRMQALERLRQLNYGYGPGKPQPKFQRVLRVIEMGQT